MRLNKQIIFMASVFVFGLVFSLSDIVPAHAMSMKDLLEMSEGRELINMDC